MKRLFVGFGVLLSIALGACATTDHSAAVALGAAGVSATQALSDQTSRMGQAVSDLGPIWGVRDALSCVAVKSSLRPSCLAGASAAPNPALSGRIAQISDVIAKRKLAVDSLNRAYASLVDLAKYNAGSEAVAALSGTFSKINAFVAASSALTPGVAVIPPITATVQNITGGVLAIAADARQSRQIAAANRDLRLANEALVEGLTKEKQATASLLVVLQSERADFGGSLLRAGLITPMDVLTPVIVQDFPGIHVATPPAANDDVILAAAENVLAGQNQSAAAAAPKSYDDALAALASLAAQHQKLETAQPLDFRGLESEIASLQVDLATLAPPPAKTVTTPK